MNVVLIQEYGQFLTFLIKMTVLLFCLQMPVLVWHVTGASIFGLVLNENVKALCHYTRLSGRNIFSSMTSVQRMVMEISAVSL